MIIAFPLTNPSIITNLPEYQAHNKQPKIYFHLLEADKAQDSLKTNKLPNLHQNQNRTPQ